MTKFVKSVVKGIVAIAVIFIVFAAGRAILIDQDVYTVIVAECAGPCDPGGDALYAGTDEQGWRFITRKVRECAYRGLDMYVMDRAFLGDDWQELSRADIAGQPVQLKYDQAANAGNFRIDGIRTSGDARCPLFPEKGAETNYGGALAGLDMISGLRYWLLGESALAANRKEFDANRVIANP